MARSSFGYARRVDRVPSFDVWPAAAWDVPTGRNEPNDLIEAE